MNKLIGYAVAFGALAAPALSFAQSEAAPITRAQVRADLLQLEQAGYDISAGEDAHYPANVQAAEARVAANPNTLQAASAVGGVMPGGSSESGAPMRAPHVARSTCVGPASYCTLYFGN